MNDSDLDKPATKRDLREAVQEFKNYVLERESALIWKVIALQVTLIGAIAGTQWAVFVLILGHLQWKP
jgi:hypothetical protein